MSGRRRRVAGIVVGGALAVAPFVASPLGRLGSPFALLIVLPALALALEAFGWGRAAGTTLRRVSGPTRRLLAAYVLWLGTSALLTLDVAATAGASVAAEVAGSDPPAHRWHLGAAMLGSNVGSLLFPFSNLTNLVVAGAVGIGFTAYVSAAWLPQVGAALACGVLLVWRARRSGAFASGRGPEAPPIEACAGDPVTPARPSAWAGLVAIAGAVGAIGSGFAGADLAVPFALAAAMLTGSAIGGGRLAPRAVAASLPLAALAVVVAAGLLAGPLAAAATGVPRPPDGLAGLVVALVAGGVLAASVNNLPAAAVGAVWLAGSPVAIVVAFLIGTNVAALATPHGSAATMLVRSIGARGGVVLPSVEHVRTAWRYAVAGSVSAAAMLAAGMR